MGKFLFTLLCLLSSSHELVAGSGRGSSRLENRYTRRTGSGRELLCDRCPPGYRLLAHCTETHLTECRPCGAGFYTEFWNYIEECLPCDLCADDQVVTRECKSSANRRCECKDGLYWDEHFCRRHTTCAPGEVVKSLGTPYKDTECEVCPSGHYAGAEGHAAPRCIPHTSCVNQERLVIRGTNWHDNVCVTCDSILNQGWVEMIKPLLYQLFQQHKNRRLQRFTRRHLNDGTIGSSNYQEHTQRWISQATEQQLLELVDKLTSANSHSLAEKVEHKVMRFKQETKLCSNHISEVI